LRAAVARAGPDDDVRARTSHAALDAAVGAHDARAHYRESRRFHLALIAPCRLSRLLHLLETAWNMTELLQPMAHWTTPAGNSCTPTTRRCWPRSWTVNRTG
jgi:DNA-binding GntR family transcriptional regulator